MREYVSLWLASLGVSLVLVPFCRAAALRFGYVARPRADRWHGRPTALLGGIAIAAPVLILQAAFAGIHAAPILLAGVALMFAIGLADDLASFSPVTKLVLEIGVAS